MISFLSGLIAALLTIIGILSKKLSDTKDALVKEKNETRALEIEDIREKAANRDIDVVIDDANKRWGDRHKGDSE